MNIVILGCGKVGCELAATLTGDGNDVAVRRETEEDIMMYDL